MNRNRSQEVCELAGAGFASAVDYRVLPVGPEAIPQLDLAMAAKPKAMLLTGEDASEVAHARRIEPMAFDPGQQVLGFRFPNARQVVSRFAKTLEPLAAECGFVVRQGIGTYWCNRVYYHTLASADGETPVVFVHLGLWADPAIQANGIARMLSVMIGF